MIKTLAAAAVLASAASAETAFQQLAVSAGSTAHVPVAAPASSPFPGSDAAGPSGAVDPRFAGEYVVVKRQVGKDAGNPICGERLRVSVEGPTGPVLVEEWSSHGYWVKRRTLAPKLERQAEFYTDELPIKQHETIFDGATIIDRVGGPLIPLAGFKSISTSYRLTGSDKDALTIRGTVSATFLLVLPGNTLFGNDPDYRCEFRRVQP